MKSIKIFIVILFSLFSVIMFAQSAEIKAKSNAMLTQSSQPSAIPSKRIQPASGQLPPPPLKTPKKPWTGDVHFGFVANSGNSRNKDILGKLHLKYKRKPWLVHTTLDGQLSADKEGKTANNFGVNGDAEYYFLQRHFGFGRLDYRYDEFSPFDHVASGVLGYGWLPIDNEKVQLKLKLGPGYRYQREATSKAADHDIIIYGAGLLHWNITKFTAFEQKITFEDGSHNTYTESKSAIKTTIVGNLGLEVAFTVKHNTKIPKSSKNKYKTDTKTNVVLVYKF